MVNLSKKAVKRGLLDFEFDYPKHIEHRAGRLYITDQWNARVKVHSTDYEFLEQYRGDGITGAFFGYPMCCDVDGEYLYVTDEGTGRWNVYKHKLSDHTRVASAGGAEGSGDNQFKSTEGLHVNGEYLYVADSGNNRIKKHLASDLSFVAKIGTHGSGDNQFNFPVGICGDETYLYIADKYNDRLKKHLLSDLSFVDSVASYSVSALCLHGSYLYAADSFAIRKFLASDLSHVASFGSSGGGDDQFDSAEGICTDGTYLYVADLGNDRIKTHLCSDLSFVSKFGYSGEGCSQCMGT